MKILKSVELHTSRLRLRIPTIKDIPQIFLATRFKGFNDGMLWNPPETEEELLIPHAKGIRSWEENNAFVFTLERKENQEFLGRIVIRKKELNNYWNVGFWTHPKHQGIGIMTEALNEVIKFGFEKLSATQINGLYVVWNIGSEKVMVKAGMKYKSMIKNGFKKNGKFSNQNLMVIDRKDWLKRNNQL